MISHGVFQQWGWDRINSTGLLHGGIRCQLLISWLELLQSYICRNWFKTQVPVMQHALRREFVLGFFFQHVAKMLHPNSLVHNSFSNHIISYFLECANVFSLFWVISGFEIIQQSQNLSFNCDNIYVLVIVLLGLKLVYI